VEPSDPGDDRPGHLDVAALRAGAERHREGPAWLWTHLRGVVGDDDRLHGLAHRSTFHHNGFVKIVLLPRASLRLRLHVWHPDHRGIHGADNVHGHRWAFASWIITGQLKETTYAIGTHGRPYDVYHYAGADPERPYVRHGTHLLAPSGVNDRSRGDVYTREPHELHTADSASTGLVASLVLQGPAAAEFAPVYRPAGSSAVWQNEPISAHQLRALLADVIDILQPVT
jgi:hypothetical protein